MLHYNEGMNAENLYEGGLDKEERLGAEKYTIIYPEQLTVGSFP